MGVARLSRVTVMLPRGDYQEALTYLSQFEEFHRISTEQGAFDPATEGLAVRAVRLFAQTDQAVKSLSLPLSPPMLDVIFRGVSVPETVYEAARWNELLDKAEGEARPVVDAVNGAVGRLAQLEKDEQDTRALSEALRSVADLSVDLGMLGQLKRMTGVVAIAEKDTLDELRNSLSDLVFVAQPLRGSQSVVLVAGPAGDAGRIEKVLRTLEVTPIVLPSDLPQNPPEAFRSLVARAEGLSAEKRKAEEEVEKLTAAHSQKLLACRELASVAHQMLDEVRNSGKLERMAILSGYIPASREGEFREKFARWMVYADHDGGHQKDHPELALPTLLVHSSSTRAFAKVTESQGLPGRHEVDPTPIISLVFPVFFGMMFGDLGHGLVVTAFGLLLRSRSDRNLKQWGTIFTTAGISASVFGTLFGEIFGFSIGQLVPIPPLLEIVTHTSSGASLNSTGITTEGTREVGANTGQGPCAGDVRQRYRVRVGLHPGGIQLQGRPLQPARAGLHHRDHTCSSDHGPRKRSRDHHGEASRGLGRDGVHAGLDRAADQGRGVRRQHNKLRPARDPAPGSCRPSPHREHAVLLLLELRVHHRLSPGDLQHNDHPPGGVDRLHPGHEAPPVRVVHKVLHGGGGAVQENPSRKGEDSDKVAIA
ncbi:MAG: hypothetical protein E6K95_09350 [Thaumarchaeota archaeon]|nr:MAG: hypothetical protein E6K95_09350 [Nitrososphaerota archaeon]